MIPILRRHLWTHATFFGVRTFRIVRTLTRAKCLGLGSVRVMVAGYRRPKAEDMRAMIAGTRTRHQDTWDGNPSSPQREGFLASPSAGLGRAQRNPRTTDFPLLKASITFSNLCDM